MPYGDGTGPWGRGPMTGRAAGYCAGFGAPGFANPVGRGFGRGGGRGRGFGWGRGRGRGFGWRYGRGPIYASPPLPVPVEPYPGPYYGPYYGGASPEEERSYLEDVLKDLEAEIKGIKDRLKELSEKKKE